MATFSACGDKLRVFWPYSLKSHIVIEERPSRRLSSPCLKRARGRALRILKPAGHLQRLGCAQPRRVRRRSAAQAQGPSLIVLGAKVATELVYFAGKVTLSKFPLAYGNLRERQ